MLWQWVLMTLLDPVKSLSYFIYLNYPGDVSTAFQISRRRRIDRKKQCTQRNVTNCFMFGPDMAGKTTLLRASIGRYSFMLDVKFGCSGCPQYLAYYVELYYLFNDLQALCGYIYPYARRSIQCTYCRIYRGMILNTRIILRSL